MQLKIVGKQSINKFLTKFAFPKIETDGFSETSCFGSEIFFDDTEDVFAVLLFIFLLIEHHFQIQKSRFVFEICNKTGNIIYISCLKTNK